MSSKTKKKDKKKSKNQNDKIELKQIAEEEIVAAPKPTSAKTAPEPVAAKENGDYKVKIIPAPGSQTNIKYEETTAAALNSIAGEGYKLLCVLPSADSKKLVAFFKSTNKADQ